MLVSRVAESSACAHRSQISWFRWMGKGAWFGMFRAEGRETGTKRLLVTLLSILIIVSLWVLSLMLGFPLFPCFLWPDVVIYCSEGRLYMS